MSGFDESQEVEREEMCPVMSALTEYIAGAAGLIRALTVYAVRLRVRVLSDYLHFLSGGWRVSKG